jgi:hypothetical protein
MRSRCVNWLRRFEDPEHPLTPEDILIEFSCKWLDHLGYYKWSAHLHAPFYFDTPMHQSWFHYDETLAGRHPFRYDGAVYVVNKGGRVLRGTYQSKGPDFRPLVPYDHTGEPMPRIRADQSDQLLLRMVSYIGDARRIDVSSDHRESKTSSNEKPVKKSLLQALTPPSKTSPCGSNGSPIFVTLCSDVTNQLRDRILQEVRHWLQTEPDLKLPFDPAKLVSVTHGGDRPLYLQMASTDCIKTGEAHKGLKSGLSVWISPGTGNVHLRPFCHAQNHSNDFAEWAGVILTRGWRAIKERPSAAKLIRAICAPHTLTELMIGGHIFPRIRLESRFNQSQADSEDWAQLHAPANGIHYRAYRDQLFARPLEISSVRSTLVLVAPTGTGKSDRCTEAIMQIHTECGFKTDHIILCITSRRGLAIELESRFEVAREKQLADNCPYPLPQPVLYLRLDKYEKPQLSHKNLVIIQQESLHWMMDCADFHRRLRSPQCRLTIWMDEWTAQLSHFTTTSTFGGTSWSYVCQFFEKIVPRADTMILSDADLQPESLRPLMTIRPPDALHSLWYIDHLDRPVSGTDVLVLRDDQTVRALLNAKFRAGCRIVIAEESKKHLMATIEELREIRPDARIKLMTADTPEDEKIDQLSRINTWLADTDVFGHTVALQYGTNISAENLFDAVFVFARGKFLHHFDIGQVQSRLRRPAESLVVLYLANYLHNAADHHTLPTKVDDILEYVDTCAAHLLLSEPPQVLVYDPAADKMINKRKHRLDQFADHALALTLRRQHIFHNQPISAVLCHQASRIDTTRAGLFIVPGLSFNSETSELADSIQSADQNSISRALGILVEFEENAVFRMGRWYVRKNALADASKRILGIVTEIADIAQIRRVLTDRAEFDDNALCECLSLSGLPAAQSLANLINGADINFRNALRDQRAFYRHLAYRKCARYMITDQPPINAMQSSIIDKLIDMLSTYTVEGVVGTRLLLANRFTLRQQQLQHDELVYCLSAIKLFTLKYPTWKWRQRETMTSVDLMRLTNAVLKRGPLSWWLYRGKLWSLEPKTGVCLLLEDARRLRDFVLTAWRVDQRVRDDWIEWC